MFAVCQEQKHMAKRDTCKCFEYWNITNQKMIFMLLSPMWGRIHEMKGYFEHHAHKPWPRMCDRIVVKFYKKQTKFENHKFCHDIMISYDETMVKIWEGFAQVVMYAPYKSKHLWRRSIELRSSRPEFESKWWAILSLSSKLFVYAIPNLDSFMPNFGNFLDPFHNFNFFGS
jgi:hypothetical protein